MTNTVFLSVKHKFRRLLRFLPPPPRRNLNALYLAVELFFTRHDISWLANRTPPRNRFYSYKKPSCRKETVRLLRGSLLAKRKWAIPCAALYAAAR